VNARLDVPPTRTDPALQVLLVVATIAAVLGTMVLVRAALATNVGHVTLQVDNQAGLPLTVAAFDRSGTRLAVTSAAPKAQTTVDELVDIGERWTFVAAYAGREVHRQTLSKAELRARGWTITIPASTTRQLEQAGFR
jgi:hypothetical protein